MTTTDEPRLDHDARCAIWRGADVATGCTCRDDDGKTPRTPWMDGPWLALDTETTGVDVATDRIVTATIIIYTPGEDRIVRQWLADPGVEIAPGATEVHGISTAHAREHGRPAPEVIGEVAAVLAEHWTTERPLIAYNGSFDLSILDNELRRHHRRGLVPGGYVVDPLVIDKGIDRYRKGSRKLVDVCAHYRVRLDGAHDATEDAYAAARVAWRIAKDNPEIGLALLADLHAKQAGWYADQQRSFASYLRRKVAPTIEDDDERQALLERADTILASAGDWPMRGAAS